MADVETTFGVAVDSSKAEAGAGRVKRAFSEISRGASRSSNEVRRGVRNMERSLLSARRTAVGLRSALASIGLGFGLARAVQTLENFEFSMSAVAAITGAFREDIEEATVFTAAQFETLADKARQLGATTVFTANQAADGMKLLGQAGFNAGEILKGIEGTLALATAGAIDLAKATSIAASTVRGFGLDASETARVADVLAKTMVSSNTTVLDLGEALKFVAPVASTVGQSVEDVTAALGLLGNVGLRGTIAGTALRRIFVGLTEDTQKVRDSLHGLGLTFAEVDPRTKSLVEIMKTLGNATKDPTRRALDLGEAFSIFGVRGGPAALALANFSDQLERLAKQTNNAEGSARLMAEVMQQNLRGSVLQLISALQELVLTAGDQGLLSVMRDLVDDATGIARALAGIEAPARSLKSRADELGLSILGLQNRYREMAETAATIGTLLVAALGSAVLGGAVRGLLGIVQAFAGVIGAARAARVNIVAFGASLSAIPYIGIVAGLTAVGFGILQYMRKSGAQTREIEAQNKAIEKNKRLLGELSRIHLDPALAEPLLPKLQKDIISFTKSEASLEKQISSLNAKLKQQQNELRELKDSANDLRGVGEPIGDLGIRDRLLENLHEQKLRQTENEIDRLESQKSRISTQIEASQRELNRVKDALRKDEDALRQSQLDEQELKAKAEKARDVRKRRIIEFQIKLDLLPEGQQQLARQLDQLEREFENRKLELKFDTDTSIKGLDDQLATMRDKLDHAKDQLELSARGVPLALIEGFQQAFISGIQEATDNALSEAEASRARLLAEQNLVKSITDLQTKPIDEQITGAQEARDLFEEILADINAGKSSLAVQNLLIEDQNNLLREQVSFAEERARTGHGGLQTDFNAREAFIKALNEEIATVEKNKATLARIEAAFANQRQIALEQDARRRSDALREIDIQETDITERGIASRLDALRKGFRDKLILFEGDKEATGRILRAQVEANIEILEEEQRRLRSIREEEEAFLRAPRGVRQFETQRVSIVEETKRKVRETPASDTDARIRAAEVGLKKLEELNVDHARAMRDLVAESQIDLLDVEDQGLARRLLAIRQYTEERLDAVRKGSEEEALILKAHEKLVEDAVRESSAILEAFRFDAAREVEQIGIRIGRDFETAISDLIVSADGASEALRNFGLAIVQSLSDFVARSLVSSLVTNIAGPALNRGLEKIGLEKPTVEDAKKAVEPLTGKAKDTLKDSLIQEDALESTNTILEEISAKPEPTGIQDKVEASNVLLQKILAAIERAGQQTGQQIDQGTTEQTVTTDAVNTDTAVTSEELDQLQRINQAGFSNIVDVVQATENQRTFKSILTSVGAGLFNRTTKGVLNGPQEIAGGGLEERNTEPLLTAERARRVISPAIPRGARSADLGGEDTLTFPTLRGSIEQPQSQVRDVIDVSIQNGGELQESITSMEQTQKGTFDSLLGFFGQIPGVLKEIPSLLGKLPGVLKSGFDGVVGVLGGLLSGLGGMLSGLLGGGGGGGGGAGGSGDVASAISTGLGIALMFLDKGGKTSDIPRIKALPSMFVEKAARFQMGGMTQMKAGEVPAILHANELVAPLREDGSVPLKVASGGLQVALPGQRGVEAEFENQKDLKDFIKGAIAKLDKGGLSSMIPHIPNVPQTFVQQAMRFQLGGIVKQIENREKIISVPFYQKGGVVTEDKLVMLHGKQDPEIVIPLSQADRFGFDRKAGEKLEKITKVFSKVESATAGLEPSSKARGLDASIPQKIELSTPNLALQAPMLRVEAPRLTLDAPELQAGLREIQAPVERQMPDVAGRIERDEKPSASPRFSLMIENQTGAKIESENVQATPNAEGGLDYKVVIKKVINDDIRDNGTTTQALSRKFGLDRKAKQR